MLDSGQISKTMELARTAQAGSMAAFEELVRTFETRVFSFVCMLCGSREDAMEITQDTFVKAFQSISDFDPEQPFAPWLFTIARHKTIDHFRSRKPQPTPPDLVDEEVASPMEVLARTEDAAQLWRLARRSLPALQFQATWLRYAEDLDVREIAHVLGCTQTSVKVLLFRARLALAKKLRHSNAKESTNQKRVTSANAGNAALIGGQTILSKTESP